jgi:hypothetical protein
MPELTTERWMSRWRALEPGARVRVLMAVPLTIAVCAVLLVLVTEPPAERILSVAFRAESMDDAEVLKAAGPPARVFTRKDAPGYAHAMDGCFSTPEGQRYLEYDIWRSYPGLVWRALDVRAGMIVMCVNRAGKITSRSTVTF